MKKFCEWWGGLEAVVVGGLIVAWVVTMGSTIVAVVTVVKCFTTRLLKVFIVRVEFIFEMPSLDLHCMCQS